MVNVPRGKLKTPAIPLRFSANSVEPGLFFAWWPVHRRYEWRTDVKLTGTLSQRQIDGSFMMEHEGLERIWTWMQQPPHLVAVDSRFRRRTLFPLNDPAFHREFMDLEISEDSILGFASRFGLLGRITFAIQGSSGMTEAESMNLWSNHILKMRRLERVWRLIDQGGRDAEHELASYVHLVPWTDEARASWNRDSEEGFLMRGATPLGVHVPASGSLELSDAARFLVLRELNHELAEGALPWIDIRPNVRATLVARDLLGAIYMGFIQSLTGTLPVAQYCHLPDCGAQILDPRPNKRYCCEEHRVRDEHRRRRQRRKASERLLTATQSTSH